MTGKREIQKADREKRIFKAACYLFATQGYEHSRMEQLARRAGLSVGTLYNYYNSKGEILLAVIRRELKELAPLADHILTHPPLDPAIGLSSMAEVWLDVSVRDRGLWRNLWAAALSHPAPYEAGFFEIDEVLTAKMARLIAQYQRRRLLAADISAKLVAAIVYSSYSTMLMAFLWDKRISVRQLKKSCRAATRVVILGLTRA